MVWVLRGCSCVLAVRVCGLGRVARLVVAVVLGAYL